jgi:hypothetical protein
MLNYSEACAESPAGRSRQYTLAFRGFLKTAIPDIWSVLKGITILLSIAFIIGNTLLLVYGFTLVWRFAFKEIVVGPLRLLIAQ